MCVYLCLCIMSKVLRLTPAFHTVERDYARGRTPKANNALSTNTYMSINISSCNYVCVPYPTVLRFTPLRFISCSNRIRFAARVHKRWGRAFAYYRQRQPGEGAPLRCRCTIPLGRGQRCVCSLIGPGVPTLATDLEDLQANLDRGTAVAAGVQGCPSVLVLNAERG